MSHLERFDEKPFI